jgi:hypothetical protein
MRPFTFALAAIALAACGGGAAVNETDGGTSGADASLGNDATIGSSDASGGADSSADALDASSDAPTADASDASVDSSADAGPLCYANSDCKGGTCNYSATVCSGTTCTTSFACPGTCVPFAEDGGLCFAGAPPACDPDSGLVCDPFSHVCVSPSQEIPPTVDAGGASCGLGVANCGAGLFCYAPVFPDNGVCLPIAGDGGACDPTSAFGGCGAGLVCAGFGSSLDAGVCIAPVPAGGPCVAGTAGQGSSGCAGDALCVDGGCALLPASGACLEGQCDPDAGYCGQDGGCAPFVGVGGACTANAQCASRLCASTTGTCVTALPDGAECGSLPYDCTNGVCAGDAIGCASGICDSTEHCAEAMCARDGG